MGLNYQLALLNVNFDNTYNDVIRFNTREEQETYFKVDELFSSAININFNVGSFYKTVLTYVVKAGEDLADKMNYNYCIVKDNNVNAKTKYFYYFINESKFNNANQIQLSVELDVMNTYLLDMAFDNCLIERAHLNRFKSIVSNPNKVTFDWDKNSNLYEREPIENTAKHLISRKKVIYNYDLSADSYMNNWIDYSKTKWVYVFLSIIKDTGYNKSVYVNDSPVSIVRPFKYTKKSSTASESSPFSQPYIVICYPLYNEYDLKFKYGARGLSYVIDGEGADEFIKLNGGYANVITAKISTLAPFEITNYVTGSELGNINIDTDQSLVLYPSSGDGTFKNLKLCQIDTSSGGAIKRGIMIVESQGFINQLTSESKEYDLEFLKDDIKNFGGYKYNPKLYNGYYRSLRLTNGNDYYDYDISKLIPDGNVKTYRTEIISPDITKQYVRIVPSASSVYDKGIVDNFTGLVSNLDYSMPYSKNNLDVYIANNKNFFLQKAAQAGGIIGAGIIGVTMAKTNPAMYAIAAGSGISAASTAISTKLQTDNLEHSPEQLANANNNGIFNAMTTGADIYIEDYDTLESEKTILDMFTRLYGFTYNQVRNINDVINIRKYYNYVKAKPEIIFSKKPISNEVKRKVKEIFNKGVTFWNVTDNMFNHDISNYERWLDE